MAEKKDIDFTYTLIDKIFRLSIGEMGDFSGAMYNGDFSISLEQAQKAKHDFMASQLHITKGSRVLDMGCGWGPFLRYIRGIGAKGVGLTLSDAQYESCKKNGLEVYLKDVRKVSPEDYGTFDAIVSVGAFEHFCSREEYRQGKQDEVYRHFFHTVYRLLPNGGRFYLQTMTYGKNMVDEKDIDIHANKNSNEYITALLAKYFPGSWLPYGSEMITRNAEPFFKLVNISSGRLDYIETTNQWRKRVWKFSLEKYLIFLRLIPQLIYDRELRLKLEVLRSAANKKCFEREVMDHYRMVFEKNYD